MKKLVLSLALLVSVMFAIGQTSSLDGEKSALKVETPKSFTPILNDSSDIVYVEFDMSKRPEIYYYTLYARLWATVDNTVTTDPAIVVNSQYSLDGINYTNLDTASYVATVADTTVYFLENSQKVGYPYLRLKIAGVDSISTQLNTAVGRFIK